MTGFSAPTYGSLATRLARFDRSPRTFVHMGDSRVAGMYLDGAKRNKSTNNEWNWANRMCGNRMVVLGNFGVSGQTATQQLAYIGQAIATGAGNFHLRVGVNDFSANVPTGTPAFPGDATDTTWGAVWFMCESARSVGMRIWLSLDAGSTNQNAAQTGLRNDFNQRCREYAELTPNVILLDIPYAALNPISGSNPSFKNGYSVDGVHNTTYGGFQIGVYLSGIVQQIIPPLSQPAVDSAASFGSGYTVLTPNPMFKNSSGGTVGSGNTGALPASCSGSKTGASSAAFSIASNSDGFGNDIAMAVTNGATGDRVRFSQNLNSASLSGGGKIIQIGCEIDVAAGATGLFSATLGLDITVDGIHYFNNDAISTVDRLEDRGGYTKVQLQTDGLMIPMGVVAIPTWNFTAFALGAGSALITIRKPWASIRYLPTYPL